VFNKAYNFPSAHSVYMDYTRHVKSGLADNAWRRQHRERDGNNRGHNFAHIAGKSNYATAGITVTDGNDGGMIYSGYDRGWGYYFS
jgi:hypothetical protein